MDFVTAVPFADWGFGWLIPAIAGGIIGALVPGKRWDAEEIKESEQL